MSMGKHITKEHEKLNSKDWFLHHDACVFDFLTKNKMAVFLHPPSSPCDFLLLPEFTTALKGRGGSHITNHQAEF